jgi:hypothetical protein
MLRYFIRDGMDHKKNYPILNISNWFEIRKIMMTHLILIWDKKNKKNNDDPLTSLVLIILSSLVKLEIITLFFNLINLAHKIMLFRKTKINLFSAHQDIVYIYCINNYCFLYRILVLNFNHSKIKITIS